MHFGLELQVLQVTMSQSSNAGAGDKREPPKDKNEPAEPPKKTQKKEGDAMADTQDETPPGGLSPQSEKPEPARGRRAPPTDEELRERQFQDLMELMESLEAEVTFNLGENTIKIDTNFIRTRSYTPAIRVDATDSHTCVSQLIRWMESGQLRKPSASFAIEKLNSIGALATVLDLVAASQVNSASAAGMHTQKASIVVCTNSPANSTRVAMDAAKDVALSSSVGATRQSTYRHVAKAVADIQLKGPLKSQSKSELQGVSRPSEALAAAPTTPSSTAGGALADAELIRLGRNITTEVEDSPCSFAPLLKHLYLVQQDLLRLPDVKKRVLNSVDRDPDSVFIASVGGVYQRPSGAFGLKNTVGANVTTDGAGVAHAFVDSTNRMYAPSQSYAALVAAPSILVLEARTVDEVRAACLINAVLKSVRPVEVGLDLRLPEVIASQAELDARRDAVRAELTATYDSLVARGAVDSTVLASAEAWANAVPAPIEAYYHPWPAGDGSNLRAWLEYSTGAGPSMFRGKPSRIMVAAHHDRPDSARSGSDSWPWQVRARNWDLQAPYPPSHGHAILNNAAEHFLATRCLWFSSHAAARAPAMATGVAVRLKSEGLDADSVMGNPLVGALAGLVRDSQNERLIYHVAASPVFRGQLSEMRDLVKLACTMVVRQKFVPQSEQVDALVKAQRMSLMVLRPSLIACGATTPSHARHSGKFVKPALRHGVAVSAVHYVAEYFVVTPLLRDVACLEPATVRDSKRLCMALDCNQATFCPQSEAQAVTNTNASGKAELSHLANVLFQVVVNISESCLLAENSVTGQILDATRTGPPAAQKLLDVMSNSVLRNMVSGLMGRIHAKTSRVPDLAIKLSAIMLGLVPCQKELDYFLYSDKVAWHAFGPGHLATSPDLYVAAANWQQVEMRSREGLHAYGWGQVMTGPHVLPPRLLNALLHQKRDSGDAVAATPWLCQPLHHRLNTVHLGEWRRCNANREMMALGLRWTDDEKRNLLKTPLDLKLSTALFARGIQESQFCNMLETKEVHKAETYAVYLELEAFAPDEDLAPGTSLKEFAEGYREYPETPWNGRCVDRENATLALRSKMLLMTEVPEKSKTEHGDDNSNDEICGRPPILENSLFSIDLFSGKILAPEIRRSDTHAWMPWREMVNSLPCDNQDAKYRPTKVFSSYSAYLVDVGQARDENHAVSLIPANAAQPTI